MVIHGTEARTIAGGARSSSTAPDLVPILSLSGTYPAARRGFAGGSAYCAAKFGLNGFAQSLFYETRKSGVRVTPIFPSSVNTRLMRDLGPAQFDRMTQAEDITAAVLTGLKLDARATLKEIEVRGTNS